MIIDETLLSSLHEDIGKRQSQTGEKTFWEKVKIDDKVDTTVTGWGVCKWRIGGTSSFPLDFLTFLQSHV